MRKATVLYKKSEAGILIQHDDGAFTFRYNDDWMNHPDKPAISLTLPKSEQEYHSKQLFPFFFNMLPEGANKQAVCRIQKLDDQDAFGLLLATGSMDTIGAVTLEQA